MPFKIAVTRGWLGETLLNLRQYNATEPHLLDSHRGLMDKYRPDYKHTIAVTVEKLHTERGD